MLLHQPQRIVVAQVRKFIFQQAENIIRIHHKHRTDRLVYLLRPESRRIIKLPDQKIAVDDVFSLDQRKYILIFKSTVDLDLRILYLDKRLFLNRL